MVRSDGFSTTFSPSVAAMRSTSCSGTGAIRSTSPESSAATRVASEAIGRNSTSVEIVLGLSHQSLFTSKSERESGS
jgi:Ribonuclease G/E